MKKAIIGVILAGVTVMAGVISFRLSADALALIVGVILGIIVMGWNMVAAKRDRSAKVAT